MSKNKSDTGRVGELYGIELLPKTQAKWVELIDARYRPVDAIQEAIEDSEELNRKQHGLGVCKSCNLAEILSHRLNLEMSDETQQEIAEFEADMIDAEERGK